MELSRDQKALYYSLDPDLTIKQLRSGEVLSEVDTEALSQWAQSHDVGRQVGDEQGYHYKFAKVATQPYLIYYQGDISLLDKDILGVVGPRKSSSYALSIMEDLFDQVKAYNLVTISGGALGVDTSCHELSLHHGIPTIVVLGEGLAHALTKRKRNFLKQVVDAGGLILSEFKLKQEPTHYTYPQRNRIIAGLANMLFLPAAGKNSGSLITVDFARKMHTDVYTVPASIYESASAGTNTYLAEGKIRATLDFATLLAQYFQRHAGGVGAGHVGSASMVALSSRQQKILSYIAEQGETPRDKLITGLGVSLTELLPDITMLEMQGCIQESEPGVYRVR